LRQHPAHRKVSSIDAVVAFCLDLPVARSAEFLETAQKRGTARSSRLQHQWTADKTNPFMTEGN